MALKMTKRGQLDNEVAYEFVCDTTADLQAIDPKYVTMGSVATVIEGDAGFEVYMANSQKEWVNLGSAANSSGDSSGNNNSTPTWVNQDIIVSIPETASMYDINAQSNIQLNNHTITGNILNASENEGGYYNGVLCVKIDPSLISSLFTFGNTSFNNEEDRNKEWYMICNYASIPDSDLPYIPAGMKEMVIPPPIYIDANDTPDNIFIEIYSLASSLKIYKMPGYVIKKLLGNDSFAISYILSNFQPEAVYDISQLTYIPPEVGE